MESNKSYLYRHTKLGTSEVFYIGIGQAPNYKRAYDKTNRSKWWKSLTNKYGFEVEILSHNLSWDEACELEKILVTYYGRIDKKEGTLVNMTDGGEGRLGFEHTEEWKKTLSESMKGKPKSIESREKLSKSRKGMVFTEEHKLNLSKSRIGNNNNSKKIIDTVTLEIFISLREAAKSIKRDESTFRDYLKGRLKNKTNMIYLSEYINQNPNFKWEE